MQKWRTVLPVLTICASTLMGCAGSTALREGLVVNDAPPSLRQACQGPVALPSGEQLTRAQVERYWSQDRARLVTCKNRHGATVSFYMKRDEALRETR